jgi:hypothetical protein
LRGNELIADGITKSLQGPAFDRFLQDLGMTKEKKIQKSESLISDGHGGAHQAVLALTVGCALLSQAEAVEEEVIPWDGLDAMWISGAMLMCLGVVYLGNMSLQLARCCLKRIFYDDDESESLTRRSGSHGAGASNSMRQRSGSHGATASTSLTRRPGSHGATVSKSMTRPSGLHGVSSSESMRRRSGSAEHLQRGDAASSSSVSSSQSGSAEHLKRGNAASSSSVSRRQSGVLHENLSGSSEISSSDPHGRLDRINRDGISQAGRTGTDRPRLAAASNDLSARRDPASSPSENSVSEAAQNRLQLMNPWNLFQHLHRGKGWSVHKMALEYGKAKNSNF